MPEINACYLLLSVLITVVVTHRFGTMPFLVMLGISVLYGFAQGDSLSWTAKSFNMGFGQTIAFSGLAIVCGAMVAELASFTPSPLLQGGLALLSGLGGSALSALAVMTPALKNSRSVMQAVYLINAAQGCLLPSPIPIAAIAILNGSWQDALRFGIPVALCQVAAGFWLSRRLPHIMPQRTTGRISRQSWGGLLAVVVMIALIIGQSVGLMPSEPLGGGPIREGMLGLGRPMILLVGALGVIALFMLGSWRSIFRHDGPAALGATKSAGVVLSVGAAGGFMMILHSNGMADLLAERVSTVNPAWGVALPFMVAMVHKALQGSSLTAAITAAGMMQPLVAPLGLNPSLAAIAIGVGAMALPHINDGYFWLATERSGLSPLKGLQWMTGGTLIQSLCALVILCVCSYL